MQPANTDLSSLIANTSSDDLKWGNFPWIQLLAGVGLAIGLGLFLQRMEVENPLRLLRRDLQKLASGDLQKIDDARYGGHIGGLARDVNAAVERFTHSPSPRSDAAGKDLGRHPGPVGREHLRPARTGLGVLERPAAARLSAAAARTGLGRPAAVAGIRKRAARLLVRPAAPQLPTAGPGLHPAPAGSLRAGATFASPPAATNNTPPPARFSATVFGGWSGGGVAEAASSGSTSSPSLKMPWSTLPSAALEDGGRERTAQGESTRVVPYDADEEEEAHFGRTFDDFLDKKRQCGESTVGLSRDKFLQKLRDNKAALIDKHGCRTVRFSVYIKDGKAALKATPVRE